MSEFKLHSEYKPAGDQPKAIKKLVDGIKKGEDHQTLLGVTGSGKSVTSDSGVLIREDGAEKQRAIGVVVDELLEKNAEQIQIVGSDKTELLSMKNVAERLETYSFDPQTKCASWKPIVEVTRHRAPDTLFQVTTSCGRNITVTGDHNFYVLRNGILYLVPTSEIQKGDHVPIPRSIPEPTHSMREIDLLAYGKDGRSYVHMPNFSTVWKDQENILRPLLTPAKIHNILHNGERVQAALFEKLAVVAPQLKKGALIGSKRKDYHYSISLNCTDQFMRLLGYYIGEGHAADRYVMFSNTDHEIVDDMHNAVRGIGLSWRNRPGTCDYQISSLFWRGVLAGMCGENAQRKHLPSFWPQLSNSQLASMLSAYFSTDGWVEKGAVCCATASKQLASDLMYALLRFGIVARLRERIVRVPGAQKSTTHYVVSVSGKKFLDSFSRKISFTLRRKRDALHREIKERHNTNVDLIPSTEWIAETRKKLSLSQQDTAEHCGIERSYISMIEHGKRNPSRDIFKKILACFTERALLNKEGDTMRFLEGKKSLLQQHWSPVVSIEKKYGNKFVYDFSVKDNETFLAGNGGIFVHNTFTIANVIEKVQKPTLVIAHNKTLAAQLAQEYKEFFPENAVHYFVSYYDYYQPEAYIPTSDTYIEKDAQINEEIDRLRHATTQSLLTRNDVIIVASVSCIYGIGSPEEYREQHLEIAKGMRIDRRTIISDLVGVFYERTNADLTPGAFRAVGNKVEIMPVSERVIYQLVIAGGTIDAITKIDAITRELAGELDHIFLFPAKHFVTPADERERAIAAIKSELAAQLKKLTDQGKPLEADRLKRRTNYDVAMMREVGYCNGIENYSRHLSGRKEGDAPDTLLSYFQRKKDGTPDFLTIIDESHVTIPQIGGMFAGDRSRKETLVEHGFRLPSALDNRPLTFDEFEDRVGQVIYTSATPGEYEKTHSTQIVEQIIRPTGLVDPKVEVKPVVEKGSYKGQVNDFIIEAEKAIKKGGRVLATTLTKRMAEDLSAYLKDQGMRAEYLHSEVKTIDRIRIISNFRRGEFDCLVGVNLLREGLDIPEVTLIGILDADKEGFLRSETSLIQTIGRAARNAVGRVILYADTITGSMERAMDETERRRQKQEAYNKAHGITPKTITKQIHDIAEQLESAHDKAVKANLELDSRVLAKAKDPTRLIKQKEKQMNAAVKVLDFETAAILRDEIRALLTQLEKQA